MRGRLPTQPDLEQRLGPEIVEVDDAPAQIEIELARQRPVGQQWNAKFQVQLGGIEFAARRRASIPGGVAGL